MVPSKVAVFSCVLGLLALSANVWAFTIETVVTRGCHEQITLEALSRVGWSSAGTPPKPRASDLVLAQNVPFLPPPDWNLWSLALLVGVRDNDLQGVAITDLPEHAAADLGPHTQSEHCLRAPGQDYASGDAEATAACRAFIAFQLEQIAGDSGTLDLSVHEPVPLALKFQRATVSLPRVPYRLGRALHALQDSFTHTYRSEDMRRVHHVFNFVDPALAGDYQELRDGKAHVGTFDRCERSTEFERVQVEAAVSASARVFEAVLAPAASPDERRLRIQDALDGDLSADPTCDRSNGFCGSMEVYEAAEHAAMSSCAGVPGGVNAVWFILGAWLLRRRRAKVLCALLAAFPAAALEPRPSVVDVSAAIGGSLDRAGLSAEIGARWNLSQRFGLGLNFEYSPWFDVLSGSVAPGTGNVYATGTLLWARLDGIELRSSANLGVSVLLFDVVGANAGSVGPYLGLSLLNVSVRLGPSSSFELRPDIVVAVPQLRGVPFAYRQYRLLLGLRWDL